MELLGLVLTSQGTFKDSAVKLKHCLKSGTVTELNVDSRGQIIMVWQLNLLSSSISFQG